MQYIAEVGMGIVSDNPNIYIYNKTIITPDIYAQKYNDYMMLLYEGDSILSLGTKSLAKKILFFPYDKVNFHMHWLGGDIKGILSSLLVLLFALRVKIKGGVVVWTVHNKKPHHNSNIFLNKILYSIAGYLADSVHVHCFYAIREITNFVKVKKKIFIYKHPTYNVNVFPKHKALNIISSELGINFNKNSKVILIYGIIAEYKKVNESIKILRASCDNSFYELIIAGKNKIKHKKYFMEYKMLTSSNNIHIFDDYLSERQIDALHGVADIVLHNHYRDILTSGSVVRSLSYPVIVVAPSYGCIREIVDEKLKKFSDEEELSNLLKNLVCTDF